MASVADKVAQFLPTDQFQLLSATTTPTKDGGCICVLVAYDPPPKDEETK